jgi:lysozyme family protein
MANFQKAVEFVLWQEDDHRQPGKIVNLGDGVGLTRLGITQKNYSGDVPDSFFSTLDFKDAVSCAKAVYRKFYWNSLAGDSLSSDLIAALLLSFAVNKNTKTAIRCLQGVLNTTEDGVLGPITLAMVNSKDENQVAKLYRAAWANYYMQLAAINPDRDQKFLHEWLDRADTPYPNPLIPVGLYA